MTEGDGNNGGYTHKVSYNESPWPNRHGYVGVCRRGAHLFTSEEQAKKFMEQPNVFLREPMLHRWVMEKRFDRKQEKVVLVGRWKP